MLPRPLFIALASLTFAFAASAAPSAVSGLACGKVVFSALPVTLSSIESITPLGRVNPPDHMVPIRDIYFQSSFADNKKPFRVLAPVAADIVAAEHLLDDNNWTIHIKPCKDVSIYYQHVVDLEPNLLASVNAAKASLQIGETDAKFVKIPVSAGDVIGTAQGVLIMGVHDFRVKPLPFANPARYEANLDAVLALMNVPASNKGLVSLVVPQSRYNTCPIDYFQGPNKTQLQNLLGQNGKFTKQCGTHMQDVVAAAQGTWWPDLDPTNDALFNEKTAISLLNWNIDPSVQLFSFSENTAGLDPKFVAGPTGETLEAKKAHLNNAFSFPVGNGPGLRNRRFAEIKDEQIYCYDGIRVFDGGIPVFGGTKGLNTAILLRVSDGPGGKRTKLTLEFNEKHRLCASFSPWTFTGNAKTYYR